MRVSPVSVNTSGCQPLRFGHKKCDKPVPCGRECGNLDQKYDLACRIIALQKQQILALQAKNKK